MDRQRQYQLGLYEKAMPKDLTWQEKFKAARLAGFDYVELSIDETEEKLARLKWSDERLHQLEEISHSENMKVGSICLSGHRKYPLGGENSSRSLQIMQEAIHLATEVGCPLIQLAGYDVYYTQSTEKTQARFANNLEKAVEMAASAGILLGFETMETPFMDTVEKAIYFVEEIGSPYLGVYPDIGNLNNAALLYDTDILEDLGKGAGHLFATHIKETVPGRYREVPYGSGAVNFSKILAKTWDLGVRRYVTELWYNGNEDWEECIKKVSLLARFYLGDSKN